MNQATPVRLTYFLEIVSSWCWWAEPAWAELQSRYAGQVEFTWKIALMDASGMPTSREQCDWFYRRSGVLTRSPYILNSGWYESGLAEYLAPNCVAEAARSLGITDDPVWPLQRRRFGPGRRCRVGTCRWRPLAR